MKKKQLSRPHSHWRRNLEDVSDISDLPYLGQDQDSYFLEKRQLEEIFYIHDPPDWCQGN